MVLIELTNLDNFISCVYDENFFPTHPVIVDNNKNIFYVVGRSFSMECVYSLEIKEKTSVYRQNFKKTLDTLTKCFGEEFGIIHGSLKIFS